jgi:hypothetical protein
LFYSCDGQDSIKIYIKIDNDEKELANTCGKKIPLMYMSNIAWMKVVFDSGSRTHTNTGFEMEYKFLTSKNREMLFHIYKYLVLGRDKYYFVNKNSDSTKKFSEIDIIKMVELLFDNIFVMFFNTQLAFLPEFLFTK